MSQRVLGDSPQSLPVELQRNLTCQMPVRLHSKQDISLNPLNNKHQNTVDSRGEDSTIYTYDDAAKNHWSSMEA